jgi:hypothetical protein
MPSVALQTTQAPQALVVKEGSLEHNELAKMLETKPEVFLEAFAKAKVKLLENGIDVNKYPEIAAIYDRPIEWVKNQNEKGYLNDMVAKAKAQVSAQAERK